MCGHGMSDRGMGACMGLCEGGYRGSMLAEGPHMHERAHDGGSGVQTTPVRGAGNTKPGAWIPPPVCPALPQFNDTPSPQGSRSSPSP